jgi:hypothetical protein
MKFDINDCSNYVSRKLRFDENLPRITGTLPEDLCTFMMISRSIIVRMRNVSHKSCRQNQNTHFIFGNFLLKIVPFMRKCGEKKGRFRQATDDNIIRRMRVACWITMYKQNILYCSPNIIRVIRSRRIRWAGHVVRMGDRSGAYRILWGGGGADQKERDHLEDLAIDGRIIL